MFTSHILKSRRRIMYAGLAVSFVIAFAVFSFFQPKSSLKNSSVPDGSMKPDEYFSGSVLKVLEESSIFEGQSQILQKATVILEKGSERGKLQTIEHGPFPPFDESQKIKVGDSVVVSKSYGGPRQEVYYIFDRYRLPAVALVAALFTALTVIFGRRRGLFSLLGLIFSIVVLVRFIIPKILNGANPLVVSIQGSVLIAAVALYLAHGWNRKTTVALGSTLITLAFAAVLSYVFVDFTHLSGIASEETFYLQLGLTSLDTRGLLLGGMIIGILGVLDDITVAQVAVVTELKKANPALPRQELWRRGLVVGREHIASLVNTLALAYAGASFPLLLLFAIDTKVPLWVNMNSEYIIEEVIRTLVGSIALLFAVPISTFLAACYAVKKN